MEATGGLVGAIDQGTSSSRFLVFDSACSEVARHQVEVSQCTPHEGWMEQDPAELLASVRQCLSEVGKTLQSKALQLKGVGITNQRETTILWDKTTGHALHRAIVWCDNRTAGVAQELIGATPTKDKDCLKEQCGLPIHPYFSALKIKWLMSNCEDVRSAVEEGRCLFGTVDTWLMWHLTGGVSGGVHVTDVTNASRTMLMNIDTLEWDPVLCRFFGVPMSILPQIKSSSEIYGHMVDAPFKGVPICGCLGDQQAALVGQRCMKSGEAKNTYGTGCFLLYNTGQTPVQSRHGLLTTVAYKFGPQGPVCYALEGSVAVGGQIFRWLRDKLNLLKDVDELEGLARRVDGTGNVYFVPAFQGLFAPHWEPDARGIIIGLTNFTDKHHICRAAIEAVCFQSKEILDAMNQDSELPLKALRVDGGMTCNELVLQLQADLLGIPVVRPETREMTVLGAAIAAGLACGLWRDLAGLPTLNTSVAYPEIGPDERDERYGKWKCAVQRSRHWASPTHKDEERRNSNKRKTTAVFSLGVLTGVVIGAGLAWALTRH